MCREGSSRLDLLRLRQSTARLCSHMMPRSPITKHAGGVNSLIGPRDSYGQLSSFSLFLCGSFGEVHFALICSLNLVYSLYLQCDCCQLMRMNIFWFWFVIYSSFYLRNLRSEVIRVSLRCSCCESEWQSSYLFSDVTLVSRQWRWQSV